MLPVEKNKSSSDASPEDSESATPRIPLTQSARKMEVEKIVENNNNSARLSQVQSAREILQATKLKWNSRRGIELNDVSKNSLILNMNMNDHGSESYLSKDSSPPQNA